MKMNYFATKKNYEAMVQRLDVLANANPGTKEAAELKVLTHDFIQYLKKTTNKA